MSSVPLVDLYRPKSLGRRSCGGLDSERRRPRSAPKRRPRAYSPTTFYRAVPSTSRLAESARPVQSFSPAGQVEPLSLEDCYSFVGHLDLPCEVATALYAELEAENGLSAETEANAPQDLEWLVSHFGPKVETRYLLYWPQLVPALRRVLDYGLEGGSGAKTLGTPTAPKLRAERPRPTPPEPVEEPRSEWGFERCHGPPCPRRRPEPASRWGFERSHGPPGRRELVATRSSFYGGSSPSYNSTRVALAMGALAAGEEEPGLLYTETGGGLFAPLPGGRTAGGRLKGGYRPFLACADLAEYEAQVQLFREALRHQRAKWRCRNQAPRRKL